MTLKATAPKRLHLLDVDEPLTNWRGLIARCGYEFKHAEPLWMFREHTVPDDAVLESFLVLNVCQECLHSAPESTEAKREYIYGLVEAQPKLIEGEAS